MLLFSESFLMALGASSVSEIEAFISAFNLFSLTNIDGGTPLKAMFFLIPKRERIRL